MVYLRQFYILFSYIQMLKTCNGKVSMGEMYWILTSGSQTLQYSLTHNATLNKYTKNIYLFIYARLSCKHCRPPPKTHGSLRSSHRHSSADCPRPGRAALCFSTLPSDSAPRSSAPRTATASQRRSLFPHLFSHYSTGGRALIDVLNIIC